ncbi:nicotinamide N-methyltransferase-like [Rhinophrynus dorsalis]
MAASKYKHVHDVQEFDMDAFCQTYCTHGCDFREEVQTFPLTKLHHTFDSGQVKGERLLDFSNNATFPQLLSACNVFNEIILAKFTDKFIQESKKWLNKEPGAFDWSHSAEYVSQLEGGRETWMEKEENLRRKVKQVLKYDITKSNPLDPVKIPKVDCLLSSYGLDAGSKDLESCRSNLKNISSLLKVGGHLVLVGLFNASFYMVGKHKFHILNYDKPFVMKTLGDLGYKIREPDVLDSKTGDSVADYTHVYYVVACKERDA